MCGAFWKGLWQFLAVRRTFPPLLGSGQAPGPLFLLGEASFLLAKARVMNEQKGVKGETRLLQKALQLLNERMDE